MSWTPVEITAADQLTPDSYLVLCNLRKYTESSYTEANGAEWGSVYLDNARPNGWPAHKFAAHLSDLSAKGFYRPQDDRWFGDVLKG